LKRGRAKKLDEGQKGAKKGSFRKIKMGKSKSKIITKSLQNKIYFKKMSFKY
jgi:hypothetical protein